MKRRQWLRVAAGLGAMLPLAGAAQPAQRMHRIGILRSTAAPLSPTDPIVVSLPNALRELGYVEGRNLQIEWRFAGGDARRLSALARELVQAEVELIVAVSAPAVQAAQQATQTVPIVMFGNFDPVALGVVSSLARPGGNVSGVLIAPDGTLAGKRLELLKQAVPRATRIGYLAPPADTATRQQLLETRQAARLLDVELLDVELRGGDYERAFATLTELRIDALFVGANTLFVLDRAKIVALAAQHRMPAIYEWREHVELGGLMSYSTSLAELNARIASFVDRILRGARPGDLPVERPSRFALVVNASTARALGLTLPPALLLRADEVIE
jgi:putative ABC transport system substrate-binding protein